MKWREESIHPLYSSLTKICGCKANRKLGIQRQCTTAWPQGVFPDSDFGQRSFEPNGNFIEERKPTDHACGLVVGRLFGKYSVWPRLPTPSDAFSQSFFQNVRRHSAQRESLRGELQNIAEVFFLAIARYGFMCRLLRKVRLGVAKYGRLRMPTYALIAYCPCTLNAADAIEFSFDRTKIPAFLFITCIRFFWALRYSFEFPNWRRYGVCTGRSYLTVNSVTMTTNHFLSQ